MSIRDIKERAEGLRNRTMEGRRQVLENIINPGPAEAVQFLPFDVAVLVYHGLSTLDYASPSLLEAAERVERYFEVTKDPQIALWLDKEQRRIERERRLAKKKHLGVVR